MLHEKAKSYSHSTISELRGGSPEESIDRDVSPQELPNLPEELLEGVEEILEYFSENFGFLPANHEITKKIQEWADIIKSPTAHPTRVMVLLDRQINAMALPDGTIIYTAGLINRLIEKKALRLLPYPLLHEVPHFERSHSQKTWAYWFGSASANGVKRNHVSLVGMKRWHEYEADMTALFKAEKLGLPAIEYSALLRVITDQESDDVGDDDNDDDSDTEFVPDYVHGNTYERELNVAMAHTILEFSSSSKNAPEVIFSHSKKIDIPQTRTGELVSKKDPQEFLNSFDERSANFRTLFLQQQFSALEETLYSDYREGERKHDQLAISQAKNELIERFDRLGLILGHFEKAIIAENPDITSSSLHHALFSVINGLGKDQLNSIWSFTKRVNEEIPQLHIPTLFLSYITPVEDDFSIESYKEMLFWSENTSLFETVRLKKGEGKRNFPAFLWSSGGIPDVLFERTFDFKSRSIEELLDELGSISRMMEAEKYFDENDAWRFVLFGAEKFIERYIAVRQSEGQMEDFLVEETVRLLQYLKDTQDVNISSYGKFAEAILPVPKNHTHRRHKEIEHTIMVLREPVSTNFLATLKERKLEELVKLFQNDGKFFLKELGKAAQSKDYDEDDWNFIKETLLENWESLSLSWPIDFSDFRSDERVKKYWTTLLGEEKFEALIEEESDNDSSSDFSRLRFLLEVTYILVAEGNFSDRNPVFTEVLEMPLIQSVLAKLSLLQLDHIIRSYCRETTNIVIDVLETAWSKYDLTLHDDYNNHTFDTFEMGDAVMNVLPVANYEKKLRSYVQPQTLEEVTAYYKFIVDLVVLYGYGGFDLHEQNIPTETAARLIEPATTLYYESIKAAIENVDSWEAQKDIYFFLKKEFDFRPGDKRILSYIQGSIILNSAVPMADVLNFIEDEANRGFLTVNTLREFVQLRIKTYENYSEFSDKITQILDGFTSNRARDIGAAAIGEQLIEYFSTSHGTFKLFEAMMESGKDDTKLRALLAPWYWKMWVTKKNLGESTERGYEVTLDENEKPVVSGASLQKFVTFNEVIQYLYDLPEIGKMIILRKLLLSKSGLLVSSEYASEVSEILTSSLEFDKSLTPRIKAATEAAVAVGDPVYMFLTFSQALSPILLKKPQVAPDMKKVSETISFDRRDWNMMNFSNTVFTREQVLQILSFKPPHTKEDFTSPTTMMMLSEYRNVIELIKSKFDINIDQSNNNLKDVKPTSIIKKVGSATAPVGTGMLQLSAQFSDLEGPYAELLDVYDQNEEQTFFSALFIFEKLAGKDPFVAEFLDKTFVSFEEVVGAGKVATTIKSTIKDENGEPVEAAIKVINPNALTWTKVMTREARDILDYIQENELLPEKDITIANKSLEIVSDWVEEELVDPHYIERDDAFRLLHENQKLSSYVTLRFPKRLGPQLNELKVDAFIEGENIGRYFRNTEHSAEQKKQVAQALADLVIRSLNLATPEGNYLLIKDISQGNAIVTHEYLYPIDRQYAEISSADRDFIHGFLTDGLTLQTVDKTVEYFGSFLDNSQLTKSQRRVIANRLKRKFVMSHVKEKFFKGKNSESENFIDSVNTFIKALDKEGMVIPSYFRLFVLKTLISMNKLFEEAHVEQDFREYYSSKIG